MLHTAQYKRQYLLWENIHGSNSCFKMGNIRIGKFRYLHQYEKSFVTAQSTYYADTLEIYSFFNVLVSHFVD